MPTTSALLGLTGADKAAAIFTALGEAGPNKDKYGVIQTILSRHAIAGGGKGLIPKLVKAPSQFVANDPYTIQQVSDPNYGRKVYGKRYEEAEKAFENPQQVAEALKTAQGATQFRGQALLSKKQKGDVMFDPRGNFYFSKQPGIAEKLIQKLKLGFQDGQERSQVDGLSQDIASVPVGKTFVIYDDQEEEQSPGAQFLEGFMKNAPSLQPAIDPGTFFAQAQQIPTGATYAAPGIKDWSS